MPTRYEITLLNQSKDFANFAFYQEPPKLESSSVVSDSALVTGRDADDHDDLAVLTAAWFTKGAPPGGSFKVVTEKAFFACEFAR